MTTTTLAYPLSQFAREHSSPSRREPGRRIDVATWRKLLLVVVLVPVAAVLLMPGPMRRTA